MNFDDFSHIVKCMADLSTLGRRIRHIRTTAGLTLEELGEITGTAPSQLSMVENGHREPRLSLLEAIAAGGPERISRFQNSAAPAVLKVQQALLLWDAAALPLHGPDGIYGQESASAVVRFKVVELQVPPGELFDDVGPRTVIRLDEIAKAAEPPIPEPVSSTELALQNLDLPQQGVPLCCRRRS